MQNNFREFKGIQKNLWKYKRIHGKTKELLKT